MNRIVEPVLEESPYGTRVEIFSLPAEESVLERLLRDLFENHWHEIVFGPFVEGAAFELRCPHKPDRIGLHDGYLTVHFGPSHFHLCIGDNAGSPGHPTPAALRRHRRTARAELYRGLDPDGCPVHWGLRLYNGAGEQQCNFFFPNPFLTAEDRIAPQPDWSRLALWEALNARYLGRGADPRDRSARRFYHG